MKKLYFSSFIHGLEKPVETMLHKEGGVAVERILPGAAIYRSVKEPAFPFVHQTFMVLFQMKPVANANEAVKRLLATGSWLDRFPYGEMEGKRFRIVTAENDKLVSANMCYVDCLSLPSATIPVCEHTANVRMLNSGCFAVRRLLTSSGVLASVLQPSRTASCAAT